MIGKGKELKGVTDHKYEFFLYAYNSIFGQGQGSAKHE